MTYMDGMYTCMLLQKDYKQNMLCVIDTHWGKAYVVCANITSLYLHVCSGQGSACPAGVAGAAGVATWIDFSGESLL